MEKVIFWPTAAVVVEAVRLTAEAVPRDRQTRHKARNRECIFCK
jgi:hypothetical protein